jgi:hypothetical protein
MAKTNFSGPITTGPIQVNTGTTVGTNVRDAAFIANSMSFPFTYATFAYATDADRLALAASNLAGTTDVTFIDTDANVPGITAIGGFEMASMITMTSSANDSALTASITGTDVLGNAQTEDVTLSSSSVASSVKTYKTVTSITIDGAGTVGTLSVGILKTNAVSAVCRSMFNADPLSQTSTTVAKNLANNIVIPPFSRITDIRQNNTVVYSENMFIQIGANVAQAAGATLNSHDLDYFAGRSATTDVKALGSMHVPAYMYQDDAQQDNCMNVSDDDASGYEIDKAVIMTVNFADTPTTGTSYLTIDWLQKVNNTN